MRLANVILSVLLCTGAFMELLTSTSTAVISLYVFSFSVMLCCFETHLKAIAQSIAANFGFLYNPYGRALFLLFIAMLCFGMSNIVSLLAGACMCVNAVFNFYVIWKYPNYDSENRPVDKLAANAAKNYIKNNPEAARQAASGAASWAAENPNAAASAIASSGGNPTWNV